MLKSVACRVFAALLIASVIGVDHATAGIPGEVAHSAMGGSTLMRTTAQFNAWTHWIVDYDNFVELNVAEPDNIIVDYDDWGNPIWGEILRSQASLHWKYDDNHFLFRVRQNDLGNQNFNFLWGGTLGVYPGIAEGPSSRSSYNAYTEGQMLNLALARRMDDGALSVGLLYATRGQTEKKTDTTPETKDSSTAFGGQVTWGSGGGLDLAASLFLESSTRTEGNQEPQSGQANIDLTGRYELDNGWVFQFGGMVWANIYERVVSDKIEEDKTGLTAVVFNAGRYLVDTDKTKITSEFFFNLVREIDNIDTNSEYTTTTLTIPGTRVAAWTQISRRFQIMGGASALWSTKSNDSMSSRYMEFSYAGGLAYTPTDNVRIEGELHMGELNNLLSLGNDTKLLTRVGAKIAF